MFLSVRSNCSGTVKHLLLTHLSLNPSLFYFFLFSTLFLFLCLLKSAVFYFLPRIFALFSPFPRFPHCLRISGEFCCCACVCFLFTSFFVVPTSVESAADVGIIPYNTLVINHASGPSAKVQTQDLTQQVAYLGYKHTHVLE